MFQIGFKSKTKAITFIGPYPDFLKEDGGGGGEVDKFHFHTCDKFQRGIREVFLSFPGGF